MMVNRLLSPFVGVILVVFLALLAWGATRAHSAPQAPAPTLPAESPAPDAVDSVHLSEVMFHPAAGQSEWVELINGGTAARSLRGYRVSDEDGNEYRIPAALPPVPAGAFVVIVFDGQGSAADDYDFSNNLATLHSPAGMTDLFDPAADQVSLSRTHSRLFVPLIQREGTPAPPAPEPSDPFPASPILSFAAWGADAGADDDAAAAAGIWPEGAFLQTMPMPGADWVVQGGSIGFQSDAGGVGAWRIYTPTETSRGAANPLPAPDLRNPTNGSSICEHDVTFGWSTEPGASGYQIQVDDDPAFGSPTISQEVAASVYQPTTPLPDGTFFFRVRALHAGSADSAYSAAWEVTFLPCGDLVSAPGDIAGGVLLDITPELQHKDTRMLNLDGDQETGQGRWDSSHESDGDWTVGNGTPVRVTPIDNMYCTRTVHMIVGYLGANLSRDRISYYAYGGDAPEGDLGHGIGLWPNQLANQGTGSKNVFNWAMNGATVTSSRGKPTFSQVSGWLDAGRPILIVENGDSHSVVMDGYSTFSIPFIGTLEMAHRIDPWTGTAGWIFWSDWAVTEYHVPPVGVTPRSDEDLDADGTPDTVDDSDGDGIVDFDEANRFTGYLRSLNPNNADSDDDGITDKLDMRAHLFDASGVYSRVAADIDNDGDRKETDRDNDNYWDTGSVDGCEDENRNGKLDGDETSNFVPGEDNEKECPSPTVTITAPISGSHDDNCLIDLRGTIESETPLEGLTAHVSSGDQDNLIDMGWSGSAPDFTFTQNIPLFRGDNLILVTASNESGAGDEFIYASCTNANDIQIQLSWPQVGSDVDLHLVNPDGAVCYYGSRHPDWGIPGDVSDDPLLDVDCINQCAVENIILGRPADGTYQVRVHYFSDHGLGSTVPTVRIWVRGEEYLLESRSVSNGEWWDVATIDWESGTVTPASPRP